MNISNLMKSVCFCDIETTIRKYKVGNDTSNYKRTYQILCNIKPTYEFFDMTVGVKCSREGNIIVSNLHLGSLSDLAGRRFTIDPDCNISNIEAAGHIIYQVTEYNYRNEGESLSDLYEDMMDLQKAKIIR